MTRASTQEYTETVQQRYLRPSEPRTEVRIPLCAPLLEAKIL
ncbi:hypothetical protein ACFLV6_00355 [Chloroflexota bacterium]